MKTLFVNKMASLFTNLSLNSCVKLGLQISCNRKKLNGEGHMTIIMAHE